MRRFPVAAAVMAVAGSLLAQTSPPSPDKPGEKPDTLCEVAGRVVTAVEGIPLKSAYVALIPERWRSDDHTYAVTSDSDGHFLLKDIPAGRYKFLSVRAGFVEQQYQSRGTEGGAILALSPGQKISDALFRMTRAAIITGNINNEDGEPVVGAQIVALQKPTEEEMEDEGPAAGARVHLAPEPETPYNRSRLDNARTDQTGHFSFACLAPAKYRVVARLPALEGTDSLKSEPQTITLSEHDLKTIELKIVRPETE